MCYLYLTQTNSTFIYSPHFGAFENTTSSYFISHATEVGTVFKPLVLIAYSYHLSSILALRIVDFATHFVFFYWWQ